jgi:hypothetical protein
LDIFSWAFGVIGDGYFWLGMIPGAFIGAWAVMQNPEFKEARKKGRDWPELF